MEPTHDQHQTDDELLAGTARGDMATFETLYRRFGRKIYHYILSSIHDDTTAQDLFAEVMFAVWKGAKNFKGDSQVSTWIFGIARHKVLDAIRNRTRHHTQSVALNQAMEVEDSDENPEHQVAQKGEAEVVKEALTTLSYEHREVLYLAFYEELPYQEIATRIEAPVNTVKTRVFYAKQQLKRALESRNTQENVQ